MASIQIYSMLTPTLPSTLDATTTINQFKDAAKSWHDAGCNKVNFAYINEPTESAAIQFMSDATYFSDPVSDGGCTHLQVDLDTWKIVYFTENSLWNTTTDIMFNSSSRFAYQWSNLLIPSGYEDYQICFQAVALHEIGHLIGFAHCPQPSAIMDSIDYSGGASVRIALSQYDIKEIQIMSDCEPPGIPLPDRKS